MPSRPWPGATPAHRLVVPALWRQVIRRCGEGRRAVVHGAGPVGVHPAGDLRRRAGRVRPPHRGADGDRRPPPTARSPYAGSANCSRSATCRRPRSSTPTCTRSTTGVAATGSRAAPANCGARPATAGLTLPRQAAAARGPGVRGLRAWGGWRGDHDRAGGRLRKAGALWVPAAGDRFVVPDRDMDDDVFVVSDMTVEVHDYQGSKVIGFNGTTEWALDSIEQREVIWLPREDQLRALLGDQFDRLEAVPGATAVETQRQHPLRRRRRTGVRGSHPPPGRQGVPPTPAYCAALGTAPRRTGAKATMLRIETFAPARRCTAPSTCSLRRGVGARPSRLWSAASTASCPCLFTV